MANMRGMRKQKSVIRVLSKVEGLMIVFHLYRIEVTVGKRLEEQQTIGQERNVFIIT